ncbi:MAG TPA: hypothetical protein VEH51_04800 [Burkholderiales bacterium]|nr:hypothetical protein [Burkholderiales bacterium]
MESADVEVLLDMVQNLNDVLDGYLVGSSKGSDAAPRLIETCRQMRARELNSAAKYWLGAIEKHATEIERSPRRSWEDGQLYSSGAFLGMQLMKDIYYLRLQLMNGRSAIH